MMEPPTKEQGVESKSLKDRVGLLEQQMKDLHGLPNRFDALGVRFDALELRFDALGVRFVSVEVRLGTLERRLENVDGQIVQLRGEMKTGDEETRVLMRVLHEEVMARFALLGEGRG